MKNNNTVFLDLVIRTGWWSCVVCLLVVESHGQGYPVNPIPFTQVSLSDQFWTPRLKTVQDVTIPYTLRMSEETGRIRNFEIAGGLSEGSFCTDYAFDDSDVFKIIEGAAYSLQIHPNDQLEKNIDELIDKIAAAQEEDGYLYTWRTIYDKEKASGKIMAPTLNQFHRGSDTRWDRVDQHSHELYNVGHLYEAAIAYYQATGKRKLLDVVLRNVELVKDVFGWGKLEKATGHQEIEIGLVKLFELTDEREYLDLAKFFLDVRGYGDAYMQNHQKVQLQREIAGHAVRACYMYAAMADITAHHPTDEYKSALNAIWEDVVRTKLYITGGIGSSGSNEGFSEPYDLPNFSAYCETCASIAFVLWNQRMFQLTGNAKYIDVLERTLYNALNAGLSLRGDRFFYPNPLESRRNHERSPWFPCACCPSNVARFFPSIPGYIYAFDDKGLYVNLFVSSRTSFVAMEGFGAYRVDIRQESDYPWNGNVKLEIKPVRAVTFTLKLRIPGWVEAEVVPGGLYSKVDRGTLSGSELSLRVNGEEVPVRVENGYAVITRKWNKGDRVEMEMEMQPFLIKADDRVESNTGKWAFQRGPLVYAFEGIDQPDERVLHMMIDEEASIESYYDEEMFGGIKVLTAKGHLLKESSDGILSLTDLDLKAIPYYLWANRGSSYMRVWMPHTVEAASPVHPGLD